MMDQRLTRFLLQKKITANTKTITCKNLRLILFFKKREENQHDGFFIIQL